MPAPPSSAGQPTTLTVPAVILEESFLAFIGLTVRHTLPHLTQAVLEGVSFGLRDSFELIRGAGLGQIDQVPETFSVVGNMNEHQVAIGETTYGGRHELVDTTGIVDYGSLMYITLQRARTAREAIKIMGELVEKYGYHSSGESFSIADPNEVWIMEMIGKGTTLVTQDGRTYESLPDRLYPVPQATALSAEIIEEELAAKLMRVLDRLLKPGNF